MNGLHAYRAAQRWGWGFKLQHAKACPRITRWWYSSVNRAYREGVVP